MGQGGKLETKPLTNSNILNYTYLVQKIAPKKSLCNLWSLSSKLPKSTFLEREL